jgi:hypothetical protein
MKSKWRDISEFQEQEKVILTDCGMCVWSKDHYKEEPVFRLCDVLGNTPECVSCTFVVYPRKWVYLEDVGL